MDVERIHRVLVIGAGAMGEGIGQQFAQAGLEVLQVDIDEGALRRCARQIAANLAQLDRLGLLSESPDDIGARIERRHIGGLSELAGLSRTIPFVVEAVPEVLDLKRDLFKILDKWNRESILASNTSTLPVTEMTRDMQTPDRVVGVHFFYPAHIVPLVEIHGGEHTSEAAIAIARQLMLRVGKSPIVIRRVLPGFIVNRMQAAFNREVIYMLEQGVATAEELDMAAKACFGFRLACLGPLEIHDLNGLDVVLKSWAQTRPSLCNDTAPAEAIVSKVAKGELGAKTGKGWHDYQGESRQAILARSNEKLLQQLAFFKKNSKTTTSGP